ncbi:DUF6497 family protein [Tabrizicola sp.]|uniref:DUF6497 family protein n=1 Tax=Tabrizicola sp. TaxID=2005166 RepID=UPI002736CE5F|nr:DUF6497 family protein [Tabrizicola sp.]MDP3197787.1 DUF6497 family protein [Tabrizicola sp.]
MRRAISHPVLVLVALAFASGCQDDTAAGPGVEVPSGRTLSLIDVITNAPGPKGAAARFRFLAPDLTSEDAEVAAADMQALCDLFALERTEGMVPEPQQIIISFANAAVPFGEAAPDVVQFFESFRVENGVCVWEVF